MAIDNSDTEELLRATPVYPNKPLDLNDLEYDQECSYGMLPGIFIIMYNKEVLIHDISDNRYTIDNVHDKIPDYTSNIFSTRIYN